MMDLRISCHMLLFYIMNHLGKKDVSYLCEQPSGLNSSTTTIDPCFSLEGSHLYTQHMLIFKVNALANIFDLLLTGDKALKSFDLESHTKHRGFYWDASCLFERLFYFCIGVIQSNFLFDLVALRTE